MSLAIFNIIPQFSLRRPLLTCPIDPYNLIFWRLESEECNDIDSSSSQFFFYEEKGRRKVT
jgi:hypothetical protein